MLSNKALFVVALCLAVTACGGGGGGGSAPPPISVSPPPPPPPPNMGPSLSINVTPSQINENTSFFIDLSNSTDSDGQIVRASVQQFNPGFYVASLVNAPSSGVGRFEFIAPEVFFHERSGPGVDSEVFFDVEIEDDDGSVVTERVTIIVESVVGANREEGISEFFTLNLAEEVILFSDNTPTPSFNFVFGTRPISNAASGEKQIFLLDGVQSADRNVRDIVPEELADTIPDVGPFFPSVFGFDLSPGTRQQFAVLNEIQDKIFWFAAFDPANPKGYTLDSVIDIQAPCHMEGRTNTGQDIAWVGQRNAGLSVIRLLPDRPLGANHEGFDAQIVSTAEISRSLCFVYPTRLASTTAASPQISQLDDIIAVDFDQKELVLLADYVAPAEEYELIGTIPIDTDGLTTLDIIDVLAVGAPGSIPSVIWILMSDGLQNGEHRLVMVWQDTDDNIFQKAHKFDGAVPSAMHQLKFFPSNPGQLIDAGADIVIVSSTSSEITIFEDDFINVNPTGNFIPIYKAPITFDVGDIPASSSIVRLPLVNGANKANDGLVLSFSGQRELRVFTYMD